MIAKWVLILKICSLDGEIDCLPEFTNSVKFMDFYSCNLTGHADSLRLYEDFGMEGKAEDVNQEKLVIKHHCELETIGEGT
jgi:uncharacterized protein Usg|tara:strand:- start:10836 stop:11078 length:243 start_codon:yes stop_codon:yes gene_type:complete